MASTSSQEIEEMIVKEIASRIGQESDNLCSGISVNLYQLRDDKRRTWKVGTMFNATRKDALGFGGPGSKGSIEANDLDCTRDSRFLIQEPSEQKIVEDRMIRALRVKHMGILKLRMVSYNSQISKMVSGYGICDCTLAEWLAKQGPSPNANQSYLDTHQKMMISTVCLTIMDIWAMDLMSDDLDNPSSYIMADGKVKILDSCLRSKRAGDAIVTMFSGFADVLLRNILPKWIDAEICDFAALLKNRNASKKDILGHPILLTPVQRELLYHKFDSEDLNETQKLLVNKIQVIGWQTSIRRDPVVNAIFNYQTDQRNHEVQNHRKQVFAFSDDTIGAIHLGAVMSAHYVEHVHRLYKDHWASYVQELTVDRLLKVHLPRVLTRRYGLRCHDQFRVRRRS